MGMTAVVKIALELKSLGMFDNMHSVMDMGSQEIGMNYPDFMHLIDSYAVKYDRGQFEDQKNFPGFPRMSSKPFWRALGFDITDNLDINGEHGSIYCDLNKPFLQNEMFEKYDLVTDFGNNEHPFNVAEAYRTMHKLVKKGGLLWIDQAVLNGNGFYNFDISFFESMAAANDYGIIYSAFVINTQNDEQYHVPCSRDLLDMFDYSKVKYIGINYLFRKSTSSEFQFPIQNIPKQSDPNRSYRVSYVSNRFPPERYYIPNSMSGRFMLNELVKKLLSALKFN